MTGLQWLRLDNTNLCEVPEELGKLMKLVRQYWIIQYKFKFKELKQSTNLLI